MIAGSTTVPDAPVSMRNRPWAGRGIGAPAVVSAALRDPLTPTNTFITGPSSPMGTEICGTATNPACSYRTMTGLSTDETRFTRNGLSTPNFSYPADKAAL